MGYGRQKTPALVEARAGATIEESLEVTDAVSHDSGFLVQTNEDGLLEQLVPQRLAKRLRDTMPIPEDYARQCRMKYEERRKLIRYSGDTVLLGNLKFGPWNREVTDTAVQRLIDEFDPFLLKPLIISERENTEQYVLDGQHRVVMLRRLGFGIDTPLAAMVLTGLTLEQEAAYFLRLNRDRTVSATGRFKARLIAQEDMAMALQRCFTAVGFTVRYRGTLKPDSIEAIEACEQVYLSAGRGQFGEAALTTALTALFHGWNYTPTNTNRNLVMAMGAVAIIGGRRFSPHHMVRRIKHMRLTVNTALQAAAEISERNKIAALTRYLATVVYAEDVPEGWRLPIKQDTDLTTLSLRWLRQQAAEREA